MSRIIKSITIESRFLVVRGSREEEMATISIGMGFLYAVMKIF